MGVDLTYAAPQIRQRSTGREIPVTALIESADSIPDDEGHCVRGLVRVRVIADEITGRNISDQDVFRVILPLGTGRGPDVGICARKVGLPERGVIVSGMTDPLSTEIWSEFEQKVGQVRSSAKAVVYRSPLPNHDVFSCGMLLLRSLLGYEPNRWENVSRLLPALLEGLSPLVQGIEDQDHYTIYIRIRDRLQESGDLFTSKDLPEGLWWDALVAAFRACSCIEAFSYGYDKSSLEQSVARNFARDLSSLATRVRMELFEAGDRDGMIAQGCDRVLTELGVSL